MGRVKQIWYLSPMRAAKVQASLRIRAVSPEPPLFAHTSSESRGTVRQKTRSLAPLNGWACAVKICHDGMLEDTNSLDAALIINLCGWFPGKVRALWFPGIQQNVRSSLLRVALLSLIRTYLTNVKTPTLAISLIRLCQPLLIKSLSVSDKLGTICRCFKYLKLTLFVMLLSLA